MTRGFLLIYFAFVGFGLALLVACAPSIPSGPVPAKVNGDTADADSGRGWSTTDLIRSPRE